MDRGDWSASEASAVRETEEAFSRCVVEGDFEAWAEYWAEDGILMQPGHPRVIGREQILAFLREHYHGALSISHSNWRIEGSGELAVVTNDIVWRTDGGDGKAADVAGKQMMLLAKQGGGKWVRKVVIYNYDAPG